MKLIVFLALLPLAAACLPRTNADTQNEPRVVEVQSGTFRIEVTAAGKVQPNREVEVTSKASGEILEFPFEAGDVVKKGDLLLRLDPDDEQRNVSRSEAQLQAARARLEKARSELEVTKSNHQKSLVESEAAVVLGGTKLREAEARFKRQEQLFKEKMISEENLDVSRTAKEQARTDLVKAEAVFADTKNHTHQIESKKQEVKLAEVEVTNAQIALDEARERLAETAVVAAMDGVITIRYVEPGQVISSAMMNVGGGTLLMVLSDLSRLFVIAEVDEADLGGVKVGQKVKIYADAYPGENFSGTVDHIAPIGIEKNGVVNFEVKVEVEGKGLELLRPGMTTDVTITTGEEPDSLWLLSEAIQEDDEGHFIEVEGLAGHVEKTRIRVGIGDGINTQVKEGAKAGQKVIVKARDKSIWQR